MSIKLLIFIAISINFAISFDCTKFNVYYQRAQKIVADRWKLEKQLQQAGFFQREAHIGYNEQDRVKASPLFTGNTSADIMNLAAEIYSGSNNGDLSTFADAASCLGITNTPLTSWPKYRSMNGYGNNLENPYWGTSMTHFGRHGPKNFDDGVNTIRRSRSGRDLPNPREIVNEVYMKAPKYNRTQKISNTLLNLVVLYITHDMAHQVPVQAPNSTEDIRCCAGGNKNVLSHSTSHSSCLPVAIPKDDPFYKTGGVRCLNMVRSQTGSSPSGVQYGEVLNRATSYLDHSIIYGIDAGESKRIRKLTGGLLNVDSKNTLAVEKSGDYLESSDRLTKIPLGAIWPVLFTRNHNKLAEGLATANPTWNDEKLFQEARRINIAIFQRGVYSGHIIEAVFRKPVNESYSAIFNPSTYLEFTTAAYRALHYYLQSEMALIKDDASLETMLLSETVGRMDLLETRFDDVLRGSLAQKMSFYDFSPEIANKFDKNSRGYGMDIFSIDIQRGRDHGLPTFLETRRICGFEANFTTFDDMITLFPQSYIDLLKKTYESVEDIDLIVGGLLETITTLADFFLGLTFGCIVGEQYRRTMGGDAYFFSHKTNPHPFNDDQLLALSKYGISNVICQNSNIQMIPQIWFLVEGATNPKIPCSVFAPFNMTAFTGI